MKKLLSATSALVLGVGLAVAGSSPAEANAACTVVGVCFYPCKLAQSCNEWMHVDAPVGSCVNITYGSNNASVKNHTFYKWKVYHTTNCSGDQTVGISWFYPQTSGDMNGEWAGHAIGSIKKYNP